MKGKTGLWLAAALAFAACCLLLSSNGTQTASQEERRMAEVLSTIAGAGEVEIVLYRNQQNVFEDGGMVTGAVVVAQGADDAGVRLRLIRAVRTLLGLPENAVDVFAMEEKER